ncbi:hypothetical protein R5W24_004898 [Gemmata sp. JC717]|uniref:hypothetical protein n=1 Tax=Gemmata algarum TaxID=2975278 RepID=UPI0021BAB0C6|nr:hypothetical protein [Gemmata algarum]MDY3555752.1 hypothetical protein [Gemmata algarum]
MPLIRRDTESPRPCDTCDTLMTNANSPTWNEKQRRFLTAYCERPAVAPAARLAGVHRATVYRWLTEPGFAEAMRLAAEVFFQAHRLKVLAQEAERQRWRDERESARRPMRRAVLERARAARGLA